MQKIIVADRNRLLREMLTKAIDADENLEIVHILHSYNFLYDHVHNSNVDWVIVSVPNSYDDLPTEVKDILVNDPKVGVLIVSPDGRHVRVKWLEIHERVLDGVNLDGLINLLSQSAASGKESRNSNNKNKHKIYT